MDWDPRIESLITKSSARRVAMADIADPAAPVVRPKWLSAREYVNVVSQLYHAETATGAACQLSSRRLAGTQAARYLALQAAEEARHADLYHRYLARLGDIAPMDEALGAALDGAIAWDASPLGPIVAFNVVLESEAVTLQQRAAHAFPCPILRAITTNVAVDEARHVAFGDLYLRRALDGIGIDERHAIYRRVKSLWFGVGPQPSRRGVAAMVFKAARRRYLADRWPVQRRNLARVGLIRDGETAPDEP